MSDPLEQWLQVQAGDTATITERWRIATGNSRANWFVKRSDGKGYVVRVEQGGVFGTSSEAEFVLMEAANKLGCSVAPVRWFEQSGDVLGEPFFVMDFITGAPSGRNDRSMTDELADDFVRRLDELHKTDWATVLEGPASAIEATHHEIERWYNIYRSEDGPVLPLLEEGAAWLHRHAPEGERVGLVHSDPGPGNFVHDGSRVLAFTDWEFSHLGDPMEDWAYLVSMRGSRTMSPEQWVALFKRVAGVEVTSQDLQYWSTFNMFKGACANLTCRRVFAGPNPAPNMGLIGTALHQTYMRRVAELIGENYVAD